MKTEINFLTQEQAWKIISKAFFKSYKGFKTSELESYITKYGIMNGALKRVQLAKKLSKAS